LHVIPALAPVGASLAPAADALVHEVKYVMPASSAAMTEAWLQAVCRAERERPPAWVCSVYVDRPGLELLDEKINSDYYKTKVRVRWYEPLAGAATGPAFLEIKQRAGTTRDKRRVALPVGGAEVAQWPLEDPRWLTLLAGAAGLVPGVLMPLLRMRYVRSRFLDLVTPTRIALDRNITVTAVHPRLAAGPLPAVLQSAIVEWKGPSPELPPALRVLTRLGARRQSYSKYLAGMLAAIR
jgi:hypothetical protein